MLILGKTDPSHGFRKAQLARRLPAALFSMNSALNRSLGYSPHEIVFGQRPRFPLALSPVNLDIIPKDIHSFVQMHVGRLNTISDPIKASLHPKP